MVLAWPSEDKVMGKRGSCGPLAAGIPAPMRPSRVFSRPRSGIGPSHWKRATGLFRLPQ